ncbi:unnamed protein product [Cuscuta campestris]|uniref:Uncharacterized protein n=1 Tax=Cuscuta campestris TaxID=132261 RepID=A0A484MSI9_9ASTE|nr:unnamed protein product [Cuscuta campestris]
MASSSSSSLKPFFPDLQISLSHFWFPISLLMRNRSADFHRRSAFFNDCGEDDDAYYFSDTSCMRGAVKSSSLSRLSNDLSLFSSSLYFC